MNTSSPGRLLVAGADDPETLRLIDTLRARGFVVYRKPHRRRGNHLAYTGVAGETVKLEQLEIPKP